MANKKNIANLEDINQKKAKAKSVVFTHYQGLSVNKLNQLRDQIRKAGGELVVFKNTLLRIAFAKGDELNETLSGPTATVFSYDDEIAPLKAISEFAKNNELPTLTGGYLNNQPVNADQIVKLSKLPGKLELQAKLVYCMAAPMTGMLNVLQGNLRNLVYAIKAIKDKKAQA